MAPATTTTKKPAAPRRTAATKAAPVEEEATEPKPPPELDPDGGQGDVLVIPTGKAAQPAEPGPVIEVFRYGTKVYSMPVEVTAQQSLHGLWVMKTHGTLAGGMQVIERLLGAEALDVLLTAPEIQDEHIYTVIGKVTEHLYGRAEEALGE